MPWKHIMATHTSFRRWFFRDLPLAYVLIFWAALAFGILAYSIDWSAIRHEIAVRQLSNAGKNDESRLYSGSMSIPTREGRCWEAEFDNRTGRVMDKGFLDCDKAAAQQAEKNPTRGMGYRRLEAIGKTFRHEKN